MSAARGQLPGPYMTDLVHQRYTFCLRMFLYLHNIAKDIAWEREKSAEHHTIFSHRIGSPHPHKIEFAGSDPKIDSQCHPWTPRAKPVVSSQPRLFRGHIKTSLL